MSKVDDEEFKDVEREYHAVHRQFLLTLLAAIVLIAGGAVVYHQLLRIGWVNAFYFCTVTLATVGYGDIVPHSDASKIFTIFYIFAGVGVIATFANSLVKNASLRRELRRNKRRLRRSSH